MGVGLDFDFTTTVDVYDIGSASTYTFEEDSDSSSAGLLIAVKVLAAIIYENGAPRVFLDVIPNTVLSSRGQYKITSKFETYTSESVGLLIDDDELIGYDLKCV